MGSQAGSHAPDRPAPGQCATPPAEPQRPRPDAGIFEEAVSAGARYSGLMLAARMTLAHFSVSSAMSLPKSAGVPGSGVPPRSENLSFNLGSVRPALTSALSVRMIS